MSQQDKMCQRKIFCIEIELPNDECVWQEKTMRFKVQELKDVKIVTSIIEDHLLTEAGKVALSRVVSPHPENVWFPGDFCDGEEIV